MTNRIVENNITRNDIESICQIGGLFGEPVRYEISIKGLCDNTRAITAEEYETALRIIIGQNQ